MPISCSTMFNHWLLASPRPRAGRRAFACRSRITQKSLTTCMPLHFLTECLPELLACVTELDAKQLPVLQVSYNDTVDAQPADVLAGRDCRYRISALVFHRTSARLASAGAVMRLLKTSGGGGGGVECASLTFSLRNEACGLPVRP